MMIKKILSLYCMSCFFVVIAQIKKGDIPKLIPQTINHKTGYVNQQGEMIISPEYHIAMFFSEDCNLLNSQNEGVRIFGSADYATVEKDEIAYRINKKGIRVYQYNNVDLGRCVSVYESPAYRTVALDGYYGLMSQEDLDANNYKNFNIYPQYQMLYVLDGNKENPMIVAVKNDKFGIVDKRNQIIIPFVYEDIKTNLSWKTANLFEVSRDGKGYFFLDRNNNAY